MIAVWIGAAWILLSVPFGILVGKSIANAEHLDRQRRRNWPPT